MTRYHEIMNEAISNYRARMIEHYGSEENWKERSEAFFKAFIP